MTPLTERKKYTRKMISNEWLGYIIAFTKNKETDMIKTENINHIKLLDLIWKNRNTFTLIARWSILISIMTFYSAYIFQLLINYGGNISEVNEHSTTN